MNKVEVDYTERIKREKIAQNIIKWWNVHPEEQVYTIGSLELEDPLYGCHVYDASQDFSALSSDESSNTPDELPEESEAIQRANEIYERLTREADEDEAKRLAEIEAAKRRAAESIDMDSAYNASTGAYSGLYGQTPLNDEQADHLAAIMSTNTSITHNVADLVDQNSHE